MKVFVVLPKKHAVLQCKNVDRKKDFALKILSVVQVHMKTENAKLELVTQVYVVKTQESVPRSLINVALEFQKRPYLGRNGLFQVESDLPFKHLNFPG